MLVPGTDEINDQLETLEPTTTGVMPSAEVLRLAALISQYPGGDVYASFSELRYPGLEAKLSTLTGRRAAMALACLKHAADDLDRDRDRLAVKGITSDPDTDRKDWVACVLWLCGYKARRRVGVSVVNPSRTGVCW